MAFTRRRLAACVVGAMCASAPPAEGFTPSGCFAGRVHEAAGDTGFCCTERRLAAAPGRGGGGDRSRERRAAARCSMASNSRIAAGRPGVAARSGAAKAAAAATRKRGSRDRKPSPPPNGGRASAAAATTAGTGVTLDRFEESIIPGGGAGGVGRGTGQQQPWHLKHPKLQNGTGPLSHAATSAAAVAATATATAVANPPLPSTKGFRRKHNNSSSRSSGSSKNKSHDGSGGKRGVTGSPKSRPEVRRSSSSSSTAATASPTSLPPRFSADPSSVYFKTLRNMKLLKPDEEVVLGRRIQRGLQLERVRDRLESTNGVAPTYEEWASCLHLTKDEMLKELAAADKAKKHMISANLRLVVSMAQSYRYRGLAMQDLIQEGTMGLVRAAEKFNPEMGFRFNTYATWWIKQSLITGIANQSRVIRLPTQVHAFLNSIRKYTYDLTVDGKAPTDEELGDTLGATPQKIKHYRQAALMTDSVSLEIRGGVNGSKRKMSDGVADELGNQIEDTRNPDPEDATQAFYMRGKVTALLATLKEKERKVVRARYGLDGATSKSLEEVGREMGLTREGVRRIEVKAMSKLRQPYRNYRVREHKTGQIFVDAGLRQPSSEAVAAARALIAEAEGAAAGKEQERQQQLQLKHPGGTEEGILAAAGDRPLRIEFKQGVDASESTQAVEAVLVAALDRPATAAAAAAAAGAGVRVRSKANGGGSHSGRERASSSSLSEEVESDKIEGSRKSAAGLSQQRPGPVLRELVTQPVMHSESNGESGSSAEGPGREGVALSPDGGRLLADMQLRQREGVGGQELTYLDSERAGPGQGPTAVPDRAFAAAGDPLIEVGVRLPSAAAAAAAAPLTPEEQRTLEIESKRKSLNKAWNKKSEAAVDRLERELARSAAALAMLEREQEEWERISGGAAAEVGVEEKSLSMASH